MYVKLLDLTIGMNVRDTVVGRDDRSSSRGIAVRNMDTLPVFSKPWLSTAHVSETPASAPPLSLRGGVSACRGAALVGFGSVAGGMEG